MVASQAPDTSIPSHSTNLPTSNSLPERVSSLPTTVAKSSQGVLQATEAAKTQDSAVTVPTAVRPQIAQVSSEATTSTKFRGLFIGMTKGDIEKLDNSDFAVKFESADPKANPCNNSQEASCRMASALGFFKQSDKAIFSSKGSKNACAEAVFGKDEKVEQLNFEKCFFGASDLEFQPFAQAIVKNYSINSVSCKSDLDSPLARQFAREGIGASDPRTCTGLARTGEKITITTGGLIQHDMTVEKASEKPTFN